jgi:hypothetical protein
MICEVSAALDNAWCNGLDIEHDCISTESLCFSACVRRQDVTYSFIIDDNKLVTIM